MKKATGENKKSARNDFWETALILTEVLLVLAFLAFPVKFAVVLLWVAIRCINVFTVTLAIVAWAVVALLKPKPKPDAENPKKGKKKKKRSIPSLCLDAFLKSLR